MQNWAFKLCCYQQRCVASTTNCLRQQKIFSLTDKIYRDLAISKTSKNVKIEDPRISTPQTLYRVNLMERLRRTSNRNQLVFRKSKDLTAHEFEIQRISNTRSVTTSTTVESKPIGFEIQDLNKSWGQDPLDLELTIYWIWILSMGSDSDFETFSSQRSESHTNPHIEPTLSTLNFL